MKGIFSNKWMKLLSFTLLIVLFQSEFQFASALRLRSSHRTKPFKDTFKRLKKVGIDMKKRINNKLYDLGIFTKKETWTLDEKYVISLAKNVMKYDMKEQVVEIRDKICAELGEGEGACVQDIDIYVRKCFAAEGLDECYKIPVKHIGPDGRISVYVPHVLAFAIKLFRKMRIELQYRREVEYENNKLLNFIMAELRRLFVKKNDVKYFSDSRLKNRIINNTPKANFLDDKFAAFNDYAHYGILNYAMLLGDRKLSVRILQALVNVGLIRNTFAFFYKRKLKLAMVQPMECADVTAFADEFTGYMEGFHPKFAKLGGVVANALIGGYVGACGAMGNPIVEDEGEGEDVAAEGVVAGETGGVEGEGVENGNGGNGFEEGEVDENAKPEAGDNTGEIFGEANNE